MKNTVIGGCFGLLAAILAVLLGHYLTKENIDIRYTLSDSIPANFLGKGSLNNIQQLDIVNRGDKPAEKIRIKIDKYINHYELTKYSEIDKADESFSNRTLEILYPELPPEGKIKIVFSSDNVPLNEDDIKIYHSKGVGKEAFDEKKNLFFSGGFFFILYFLLMIIFFTIEFFSFRNKWLERNSDWGEEKIFIRNKVPLLMNVDRWNELRKEAIINHINRSDILYYDIESSKILKYLNSEKPEYLKDYEWELLINEAQKAFAKKIPSCLELSFLFERKVEDFFKIEKPKHFQETKWNEILEKLHKLYVLQVKEVGMNISYFEDPANIYKKLKAINRYNISKKYWGEYLDILKNVYLFCLVKGLCRQHDNFVDYLNKYDLNVLDAAESEFLEETAYKFQYSTRYNFLFTSEAARNFLKSAKVEWIKEKDYKDLKATAEDVVLLNTEKTKSNSIRSLLNQILYRQTLSQDKPTELTDEEWEQIKELEKDMIHLISENKEILSKNEEILIEIHQKEKSIPNLIEKLNFQLSVINEFLSDPTVLERIEDYNNKFSPGNFQNLKKIASYLKNTKEA